ncbi:hypothetical protein HIC20_02935 [Buchnera aphidicola (Hormaphis cornu)]|nr:hypothetical protein HIC20_02935 [Buchnera aphidicola (Hormaphis cornu)]
MYALGIRDVGITIANNVSEKFNSLNKLMEASIDELKLVKKSR